MIALTNSVSSIFIACRQNNVPRTFQEIFALTKVQKKEIGRIFKQLEAFLQKVRPEGIKVQSIHNQGYSAKGSTSAEELCARYVSNLGFHNPIRIENVARSLASKTASVADLAGRSPLSVAAACIYMASHFMGQSRSSRQIASVAGVSEGTVKTAYRFLWNAKEQLIAPEWLRDGMGSMDKLPVN